MFLSRVLLMPLVLCALVACGDSRRDRPEIVAEQKDRQEQKDEKEQKEKKEEKKGKSVDLGDLHAEVTVLQVLHTLNLNADQIGEFGKLAAKSSPKAPPRKEFAVSEKYRNALVALRAALREADDEKIEEAYAELDAAREKDNPLFDEIEITDAARKHAGEFFKTLTARQIVFYLSGLGNTFPDPIEQITAGMEESRNRKGKTWREFRDDLAYQMGWLIAGLDGKKEETIREQVSALLDKAQSMNEKEYSEKKLELTKSARELTGKLTALAFVRHYVERTLSELLSNHRAVAAVEGRKK